MPTAHVARALVLAGGGAKGSYQIGVWRALQELHWTPSIITGASVGTLNGCMFAMGRAEEAEALWRTLETRDVLDIPATLAPEEWNHFLWDVIRQGGLGTEPLARRIDALVDEEALRRSPIRFGFVTTELGTMRSIQCRLEDVPQGQLKEYMLGSCACFPALRPREVNGIKYIDGGWRDNMPLQLAASMGATELLGVDIDGIGFVRQNTTGLPTRIVHSHWNLGPTLEFSPARAARNIALGYLDTMRLFGRCGGTAYAILPDAGDFLTRFAESYQRVLTAVDERAPGMRRTEKLARQRAGYPPPYGPDLCAPTRGALAPLELAAERVHVPEDLSYTPKLLAATFMGSFDKDPADRFPTLLEGKGNNLMTERAMATAVPEEFVTALVSCALAKMPL